MKTQFLKTTKVIAILTFLVTVYNSVVNAQENFITVWNITNGSTVVMPISSVTGNDIAVDWGDGLTTTLSDGDSYPSHTFSSEPNDTIKIYPANAGDFTNGTSQFTINFANNTESDASNDSLITQVVQWGENQYTTLANAFNGCANLDVKATDVPLPDVSSTISMANMFYSCSSLDGASGNWEWDSITSYVNNTSSMFYHCQNFNQDIGSWDVSKVINFDGMFDSTVVFNQDLGLWDPASAQRTGFMFRYAHAFNSPIFSNNNTGNIWYMYQMFNGAWAFNQDIGDWDVSHVQYMDGMFCFAVTFNQDIGDWDVSGATSMTTMFWRAEKFNQDIGDWVVSNVTNMDRMFLAAWAFDQNIGSWDISSLTYAGSMLNWCGMSQNNYDIFLNGWAAKATTLNKQNVTLGAAGLTYCAGKPGRTTLEGLGWIISGDTEDCPDHAPGGVVDNLQFWVRADDIPSSGTLTEWIDAASGLVYDNIVNTPTMVENQYNFNPTVNFKDTSFFVIDNLNIRDLTAGFTSFIYASSDSMVKNEGFWDMKPSNTNNDDELFIRRNHETNNVEIGTRYGSGTSTYEFGTSTSDMLLDNEENLINILISGGTPNDDAVTSIYLDGLSKTPTVGGPNKVLQTVDRNYIAFPADIDSLSFHGDIPEMIIYNRQLTEIEQLKVNSYLAIKYGITLDQTTAKNYLASNDTVIYDAKVKFDAYDHDIIGIGTDDVSLLGQKISRSVNDSTLIIAYDADFTSSNLVTSRNALADTTFVVVGNDGADTLFNVSYYGKQKRRMSRVWAADVTGEPDSIFVAVSASFVFPRGIPVVIVSDDETIESNDMVIELIKSEGFYYAKIPVVANTDFYFTFGSLDNYNYMRHGKHFDEKGKKREMTF